MLTSQQLREKTSPLPSEVSPRLYGDQHQPALFSFYTDDIISMVTDGGSPLLQWLPARGVNYWNEPVAHLSWIAPTGFDGSQSYADFKAAQAEVAECDFGDGFAYQICEYTIQMDRMSWSTRDEPIKQENLGMKLWQNQPVPVLRGQTQGLTINNDRDWSLARLGYGAQEELSWNVLYGDEVAYPNSFTGLNKIVTTNWVRARARGKGSCDFTDPIVVNGADFSTPEELLSAIKGTIRRLMRRMQLMNFTPGADDIAIVMNPVMWDYVADAIAFGTLSIIGAPNTITVQQTVADIQGARDRLRAGGLGFGYIPVDGRNFPVLPDTRMGVQTLDGSDAAITGDVLILTRTYKGMTILENQFLDWSQLGERPLPDYNGFQNGEFRPELFQGNMLRVTVNELNPGNNTCWFYGADMYGRMVSKMNSLQARINDVTIHINDQDAFESGSFTSPNFYAFNGSTGGGGTSLLDALT